MKRLMSSLAVAAFLLVAELGAAPVPQQTIHPGDQLSVQVFGQQSLSQTVTVMQDGNIEYPLIGRIHIGGETMAQATDDISKRLSLYVRHPYVTIAITQLAQPTVLVLGDVKTPGKYELRSDARVTDAIAAAGGLAVTNGALPEARISDPQGDVTTVPLQELLHDGDVALDKPLGEGYVVYVPGPTMIDVTVAGAVDHPGKIQVAQGDRLSMAIAQAGDDANANADLNHVKVIRREPDGQTKTFSVDLYKALEQGDSSADIALKKNDEVYVPESRKHNVSSVGTGLLYLLSRLIP